MPTIREYSTPSDSDPAQFPDDIAALKAMLVVADVRVSSLDAEVANLKLTILNMQRAQFGASVMPEACVTAVRSSSDGQ